ncbi:MAG: ATP12 family chaperone protein, partial [Pseudomonadota bacterium]
MTDTVKRFYKAASVAEGEGGWHVALDDRPVRTPGRALQVVPTRTLAGTMAEEWAGQGDTVDIARMHVTRLANVAIDRTPGTREALASEVAKYCETDLTCHLDGNASDLRARQDQAWRPVRDWAGQALGVMLVPVEGILAGVQPQASLE